MFLYPTRSENRSGFFLYKKTHASRAAGRVSGLRMVHGTARRDGVRVWDQALNRSRKKAKIRWKNATILPQRVFGWVLPQNLQGPLSVLSGAG